MQRIADPPFEYVAVNERHAHPEIRGNFHGVEESDLRLGLLSEIFQEFDGFDSTPVEKIAAHSTDRQKLEPGQEVRIF